MLWQVDVHPKVLKALADFPLKDVNRIQAAINALAKNPFYGDVLKMAGQDGWRRRVGSYRIFFEVYSERKAIFVYWVERRSSKTY